VIGKAIKLNLVPITIVGVAPSGFTGASHVEVSPDVFLPLTMQPVIAPKGEHSLLNDPEIWWVQVMGRLQPGISEDSARASLAVALSQAVQSTMTVPKGATLPSLTLILGNRGWLNYADRQLEQPSSILLALTGLVLLLACANIANLLLARSVRREREMSVRLALGAGRGRIVRQMLTESLILSMLGGCAGLIIGYLGRDAIPRLLSSKWDVAPISGRFDWSVFAFTLMISLISGLLFGVGPAWQATRSIVNADLKENTTTHTRRRGFAAKALVAIQVALCMLLLVGAGLFVRTLVNLNATDTGFQPNGLLLFAINPPTSALSGAEKYRPPARNRGEDRAVARGRVGRAFGGATPGANGVKRRLLSGWSAPQTWSRTARSVEFRRPEFLCDDGHTSLVWPCFRFS
jgi:predicted permease